MCITYLRETVIIDLEHRVLSFRRQVSGTPQLDALGTKETFRKREGKKRPTNGVWKLHIIQT